MATTGATPTPLSDALAEMLAARFRVLAEPMRIKLLDRLRDGSATVHELHTAVGGTQQNVSKHLGVLHSAGLVSRRKVGTSVRYAVADPAVFELCEQVCGSLQAQFAELTALVGGQVADDGLVDHDLVAQVARATDGRAGPGSTGDGADHPAEEDVVGALGGGDHGVGVGDVEGAAVGGDR